jgi:hypothetical protein
MAPTKSKSGTGNLAANGEAKASRIGSGRSCGIRLRGPALADECLFGFHSRRKSEESILTKPSNFVFYEIVE